MNEHPLTTGAFAVLAQAVTARRFSPDANCTLADITVSIAAITTREITSLCEISGSEAVNEGWRRENVDAVVRSPRPWLEAHHDTPACSGMVLRQTAQVLQMVRGNPGARLGFDREPHIAEHEVHAIACLRTCAEGMNDGHPDAGERRIRSGRCAAGGPWYHVRGVPS